MNALVLMTVPNSTSKRMLIASLSFIHPMVLINESEEDRVDIKLFDCSHKEQLEHRLNVLCEASSVDFGYRYQFV